MNPEELSSARLAAMDIILYILRDSRSVTITLNHTGESGVWDVDYSVKGYDERGFRVTHPSILHCAQTIHDHHNRVFNR